MDFFKKFKKSAAQVQNKDMMEAIVAGACLIIAADGTIGQDEVNKMNKLLQVNDNLEAFRGAPLQSTIAKFQLQLEADFNFGKNLMLKQIADIAGDPEQAKEVFLIMLAVAESDGETSLVEIAVLKEVGAVLGMNLRDFGIDA